TYELPPYEDGVPWTVTSLAEGERAVASLANNIKPSRLVVLSTHTRPMPELGELLSSLAAHHTGDISLMPLDSFWRPAGLWGGDIGFILDKFSDRLDTIYGSFDTMYDSAQVCEYFRKQRLVAQMQRGRITAPKLQTGATRARTFKIGVRFDCNFFNWPVYFPKKIDDVCCVRGTPLSVSSNLRQRGCSVTRWHFPDLCDEDLAWMTGILY
ncbi:uncharacterized protein LOC108669356, partial [Hyalella azteca]|uniref:Uncharacterized protein LOC108669356 n=1 Tax=Hyalella azteca TaxID=294128 RepID=A0A8B7NFD8_HYAAZ